jgi:hypothetical protein
MNNKSPNKRKRGNVYRILMRKSGGKKPLARLRRRWEDNIKTRLREKQWLRLGTSGELF